MATKTVIITGANTGLGFECAKAIAAQNKDWHIVIACRDVVKGQEAATAITAETAHTAISILPLDLASLASVHRFAALYAAQTLPPLRGLVCNAGLQVLQGLQYTQDGFELTFGVNHIGHFLLTNVLLAMFQEPARIVIVSSGTHNPSVLEGRSQPAVYMRASELADPRQSAHLRGMQRYTTSKLCNVLFGYELDRRLQNANRAITVNSFDPGGVPQTNLLRGELTPSFRLMRSLMRRQWVRTLFSSMGVSISTPEVSGKAMARLVLDPTLEHTSGKYFQIHQERRSSEESYDQEKATQLWDDTMELLGLER